VNADIENDKVTYSEFLSHSLSIASFLESIGFSKGDVTGNPLKNSANIT
jgi:acyl-coenzyme A synthetase/AMP-(fatty) acid ligase